MNIDFIKSITCPITLDIFNEPIILSDGHTYEKLVAIDLIVNKKKSPITRETLTDTINN